jgi:hypothetical protein
MSDPMLDRANKAIEEFLDTDASECDDKEYGRIYQKANMGLRIRHDFQVTSRIEVDQKLRVIGMVFTDPKVREQYARITMPKLLPELKTVS